MKMIKKCKNPNEEDMLKEGTIMDVDQI